LAHPETLRTGINTTFRYDLTKNTNLYVETAYQQNKSHIELAPSPISTAGDNDVLLPRTNYWNPFGVDLNFNFRPVDIGPRKADITNDSYRIVAGVKGTILDRWNWDTYYSYDNDKVVDQTSNAISESRLRASLAKSTPDALNIFGGANYRNPKSTLDSIRVTTQRAVTRPSISGTVRSRAISSNCPPARSVARSCWRPVRRNSAKPTTPSPPRSTTSSAKLSSPTRPTPAARLIPSPWN